MPERHVKTIQAVGGYVIAALLLVALIASIVTGHPLDADVWGAAVKVGDCRPLPEGATVEIDGREIDPSQVFTTDPELAPVVDTDTGAP